MASLVLLLLGAGPSTLAMPAGQAGEGLFTAVSVDASLKVAGDPTIIRTRLVGVDFPMLGAADGPLTARSHVADVLTLNLFADAVFTAVLDRVELSGPGSFSWIGHLEDVPYGQAILVVEEGVMAGSVTTPEALYRVGYVGEGVHAVYEIDRTAFPPEAEPMPVSLPAKGLDRAADMPMDDDGSTMDVLVAYTDDARAGAGGAAAMESLINLAVAETNTGYANSDVTQRMNLVHTEEMAYDETGFNWNQTLNRLTSPSDGYIDNIHPLRDAHAADLVVLIVNNTSYCGIAWLMQVVSHSFEDHAFSVVSRSCATGYYSFAHEAGHNMGSHHDHANDGGYSGAYPYSYGYQAPDEAFRTIMAYNCPGGCTRRNYWSNPDIDYGGQPMGVADWADNHRSLNDTAYTVANFRVSSTPPSTPMLSTPAVGGSICDAPPYFDWSVSDAITHTIQVDDDAGFGSPVISTTTATSEYAAGSPLPLNTYYWHVQASNDYGDSPWSSTWDFTVVECNNRVHLPLTLRD